MFIQSCTTEFVNLNFVKRLEIATSYGAYRIKAVGNDNVEYVVADGLSRELAEDLLARFGSWLGENKFFTFAPEEDHHLTVHEGQAA